MGIAPIYIYYLSGGMRRFFRKEESCHIRDFIRGSHPASEGYLVVDSFQCRFRVGKCFYPSFVQRRITLCDGDGIHSYSVRQQFYRPLPGEGIPSAVGGCISGGTALSCFCCFGCDIDNGAFTFLQTRQCIVGHQVIVYEIAAQ